MSDDGRVRAEYTEHRACPACGADARRVVSRAGGSDHARCAMFDGIEHVNLWTPDALRDTARRAGWRLRHLETLIPELNVLNNHLDHEDPYTGPREDLGAVLQLPELYAETILARDLGYKSLALLAPGLDGSGEAAHRSRPEPDADSGALP